MTTQTYPFTLLRLRSSPLRGESMNVGIVAFVDGQLIARINTDRNRLLSFDTNVADLPLWNSLAEDIAAIADQVPDPAVQHHMLKTLLAPVYADEQLGEMTLEDGETAAERVDFLMARLVARPPRTERRPARTHGKASTRLNLQLRDWLKSAKLFSRNVTDLSKKRVVANYPVAASNDLYAEFALMNGAVHIIETLDFRGHDKITMAVQKEAAMKSIVLDQGKRHLDQNSKMIAVIAASDYSAMRPAIGIVTGYADDVIAMASSSDRQRLADFIADSLHLPNQLPLLS